MWWLTHKHMCLTSTDTFRWMIPEELPVTLNTVESTFQVRPQSVVAERPLPTGRTCPTSGSMLCWHPTHRCICCYMLMGQGAEYHRAKSHHRSWYACTVGWFRPTFRTLPGKFRVPGVKMSPGVGIGETDVLLHSWFESLGEHVEQVAVGFGSCADEDS
jgi:hypothetical protein